MLRIIDFLYFIFFFSSNCEFFEVHGNKTKKAQFMADRGSWRAREASRRRCRFVPSASAVSPGIRLWYKKTVIMKNAFKKIQTNIFELVRFR